jgi:hypothetical protein
MIHFAIYFSFIKKYYSKVPKISSCFNNNNSFPSICISVSEYFANNTMSPSLTDTGKFINGKLVTVSVKEGDIVLFAKYSETEIQIDGNELLLLKQDDILGTLE